MSWIVSAIDNANLKALIKKSQKSIYAARFVKLKEYHEQRIKDLRENLWNAESKENDNDGKSLAERYSEAKTVTKKKRILSEINDAESDDEELKQTALLY